MLHRSIVIALVLLSPALESRAQSALYPTDACVAAKLDAAATYCGKALLAAGRSGSPILPRARQTLTDAWASAEAASDAAGVSCAETTARADEMITAIDADAAEVAAAIAAANTGGSSCNARRQMLAGQACQNLVAQQARHLRTRSSDRTRAVLEAAQVQVEPKILARLAAGDGDQCLGSASGEQLMSLAEGVVDDVLYASFVSPRVPSEWTQITPAAEIPYLGKTLDPICSRGTPWVFFVKRGTVNKTLMYYQGGGACWSYATCTLPTHDTSVNPGSSSDNPGLPATRSGFSDLTNPDNPFRDWNIVFVPYCTGDIHWGDAVVEYRQGGLRTTVHHKGFVNAQVAEKWAREHFANPEQVFVTGSSAGAYGAIMNSLPLQEYVWPSSDFAVLGDAGNGVITQDFLANDIGNWGVEQNLPAWIPGFDVPLTELDASKLWSLPALFYPHNRFANYATSFDGGQGGQVGFYNVMLNIDSILSWQTWWPPSCEWNATMREYVQTAAAAAPNYRYYIGSGSRHTMWGHNKVYSDTTGNVPLLVDWVNAMLHETPDWVNVETDDPGQLLPGDPHPSVLPDYPYTDDGRVVCE